MRKPIFIMRVPFHLVKDEKEKSTEQKLSEIKSYFGGTLSEQYNILVIATEDREWKFELLSEKDVITVEKLDALAIDKLKESL